MKRSVSEPSLFAILAQPPCLSPMIGITSSDHHCSNSKKTSSFWYKIESPILSSVRTKCFQQLCAFCACGPVARARIVLIRTRAKRVLGILVTSVQEKRCMCRLDRVWFQDPSDSNVNTLNEAKEILESYYEEKTRGVIIRARARWHEHGERSTKYFLNLEKRNHVKKHIRKLLISGSITSDPFGILNEQKRFYHSLYKSNVTDEDRENGNEFLNNLNIPRLSEENNLVREKYLLKKLQPSLTVLRMTNLLVMMEYQQNFTKVAGN